MACAALFLTTASLFAVNVFVSALFLQVTTGASPTEAGLLLVPAMCGIYAVDEHRSGALDCEDRPSLPAPSCWLGLGADDLLGLTLLAAGRLTTRPVPPPSGLGLVVFGLGFGMVGQVLTVAVQNGVDRSRLGVAMAATSFFLVASAARPARPSWAWCSPRAWVLVLPLARR